MAKIDVLVVRFLPFALYVLFGVILFCIGNGWDITIIYELHGNSALYAFALFLISLSNKKYHCIWNRAMYVFLIAIPTFNFLDAIFNIVPMVDAYITIIRIAYIITAIITTCLAIRHFLQSSIRKYYARRKYNTNTDNARSHSST